MSQEPAAPPSQEDSDPEGEADSLLAALAHAPSRLSAQALGLKPGEVIGHYELQSLLGRGGMGLVYRAWDQRLQRAVALKLLSIDKPAWQQLLLNEARAAAAVRHPHIATVFSVEEEEDLTFLTMELIDGPSLAQVIQQRRMTQAEVLSLALQMAGALAAAHVSGLVHRDLKPSNVVVQADRQLKLLDFGLARFVEGASPELGTPATHAPARPESTDESAGVAGTWAYMSPEQAAGQKRVGPPSDVFSFGLVLYEMLMGALPPEWRQRTWTASALFPEARLELQSAGVSAELIELVARCLAIDPSARIQNGMELERALRAISESVEHGSWYGSKRWYGLLAAALAGVSVWGASHLVGPRADSRQPQPQRLHTRRLTALGPDAWLRSSALHPSRELFAYVARTGRVSLQRIDAEEAHAHLAPPGGKHAQSVTWQDERTLLVVLAERQGGQQSVWRLSVEGETWEVLLPQAEDVEVSLASGSIAWVERGEVWLARLDGSEARRLKEAGPGGRPVSPLRFSPDGENLAFVRWDNEHEQHSLVIMPRTGGPERLCLRDWRLGMPGVTASFHWLPGRFLLALADPVPHEEGANLWELPVTSTGEPRGPLRQRTFWSNYWVKLSSNADEQTLLLSLGTIRYRTFMAPLAPGPTLGPVRQLTRLQRSERLSDWSGDGQYIWVTASHKGGFALHGHALDGGPPRKLTHPSDWLTHAQASPEAGLFFWQASPTQQGMNLALRHQPAGTEDPRSLLSLEASFPSRLRAPLPLGHAIRCAHAEGARTAPVSCVLAHGQQDSAIFSAFDSVRGQGRELFRLDRQAWNLAYQWDLSPDGRRIAHMGPRPESAIEIRELDGRLVAQYASAPGCAPPNTQAWAADGRSLFLTSICEGGSRFTLSHLNEQGQSTELLSSTHTLFRYVAASADGQYLAWSALELDNDLWQLELE